MLDIAIIGSGPAALSAAIYAGRVGLKATIFEKNKFGGALSEIAKISNYPGFIGSGAQLAENLKKQVIASGVEIKYGECESINPLVIDGEKIVAKTVLIATGSEPRPLDFKPSIPVSYCALCDAPLYKNKAVAVVGSGNSAVQESIHLAKIVKSLTVFANSKLKAEPFIIEMLRKMPNVTIKENTEANNESLKDFAGVFVFVGKRPATTFLPSTVLTADGFIKTHHHATSIAGIYAAGDVRDGSIKQAITSAADGVEAVLEIIDFLKK